MVKSVDCDHVFVIRYTYSMNKPQMVDEYIASFPDGHRQQLERLRGIIRAVLPEAHEVLKWGSPAMVEADGMILVIFSGHKHHMSLVGTPSTREVLQDRLNGYQTGKGSVRFSYDAPLPEDLIKDIVQYWVNEYRSQGIVWKKA